MRHCRNTPLECISQSATILSCSSVGQTRHVSTSGRRTNVKSPWVRLMLVSHWPAFKRGSGCVMHALVPCSIFSRMTHGNKALNREENQHKRPKIMIVCVPRMHVCISSVCVFLKIDSGISRALFIAEKLLSGVMCDSVHVSKRIKGGHSGGPDWRAG